MKELTEMEKVKFRKWIKANWNTLVKDISVEAGVKRKYVANILDSLRCYILFTTKDKAQSCMLFKQKKKKIKNKIIRK